MSDSCVYIQENKTGEWLPANVLSSTDTEATVKVYDVNSKEIIDDSRVVKLSDYEGNTLPMQNVDASGNLMVMSDMVDLPSLHEPAILYNLRKRHENKLPYTRVGDLIIAVNPFQWMTDLYTDNVRNLYVSKLITFGGSDSEGSAKAALPPHVYETSSLAYKGLAIDGQHQSILVSGESGAGKTETVKIVMSHLASVSSGTSTDASTDTATNDDNVIVQRVLDSHPLLEAFGNAKTVRNDNSSRFGKFIQMQFHCSSPEEKAKAEYMKQIPSCVLAGSTCETYLLEKSRVVGHTSEERTYHIFYQLLSCNDTIKAQIWEDGLINKTFDDYKYVGQTDTLKIEKMTDSERMDKCIDALTLLGITDDKLSTLLRAVCVVMQLGNIVFEQDPDEEEKSIISSTEQLDTLSKLIGIPADEVIKSLTYRTITARNESYSKPLTSSACKDGCDAFAKEIYQQIFDYLVNEINLKTSAQENYVNRKTVKTYGLIGLLDIFGFESFEINRFEQLCINYTNEKLQSKYTFDIFQSVQEEYSYEGIELANFTYDDNIDVLNLIEGRMGIISVLNEECVRPKGNDAAFVSKIKSLENDIPSLINEKLHKPTQFGIQHYAGTVTYDATGFITKNMDKLPDDIINCACKSTNKLIQIEIKAAVDRRIEESGGAGKVGPGKKKSSQTVSTKFKHQLSQLMNDISKTRTRYIRCIKPNPEKVPIKMNMITSGEQLRCAGVVAAVTISRVAFPNRLLHETIIDRFSCLLDDNIEEHKDVLQQIHNVLDHSISSTEDEKKEEDSDNDYVSPYKTVANLLLDILLKEMETKSEADGSTVKGYECGKSRIYFRAGSLELLESKRLVVLGVLATSIQKEVRKFILYKKYQRLLQTSIATQAKARRTIHRKRFNKAKESCISMQCFIRCVYAKRELTKRKRNYSATQIQTRVRTIQCIAWFAKCRQSAIQIQRISRGYIQRPKYIQLKKEAEEEARVNTKLAALTKRLQEAEMKWIQADKARIEAEKKIATGGGGGSAMPSVEADAVVTTTASTQTDAAAAPPEGGGKAAPSTLSAAAVAGSGSSLQQAKQQAELIDESKEMLAYFKKEVFKLKSANYLLRNDLQEVRAENHQLREHTNNIESSQDVMKSNLSVTSQSNMKLSTTINKQKEEIFSLKRELKMNKIQHMSEINKLQQQIKDMEKSHDIEKKQLWSEIVKGGKKKQQNIKKQQYPASSLQTSMSRTSSINDMMSIGSMASNTTPTSSIDGGEGSVWSHDHYLNKYGGTGGAATASSLQEQRRRERKKLQNKKNKYISPMQRASKGASTPQGKLSSNNSSGSSLQELAKSKHSDKTCHNCGGLGHIAADCTSPRQCVKATTGGKSLQEAAGNKSKLSSPAPRTPKMSNNKKGGTTSSSLSAAAGSSSSSSSSSSKEKKSVKKQGSSSSLLAAANDKTKSDSKKKINVSTSNSGNKSSLQSSLAQATKK